MHLMQITKLITITFVLVLGPVWTGGPQSADAKPKADKRDQSLGAATADQRKMNAGDRNLNIRIRRSILAGKSLSTYAHNGSPVRTEPSL